MPHARRHCTRPPRSSTLPLARREVLSERRGRVEREIAVLVITSRWHSAYPTAAHEKRGKEVGLPAAATWARSRDKSC